MGNILKKIAQQKKYEEKQDNYWSLYRRYAHLPPHMQPYEFTTLQNERRGKGLLELSNFLEELLNKNK
jgi:hypothetical protein